MAQRLRSLTGCLRCRQRRKKCGEEKPVCYNCRRLEVVCQWSSAKLSKDISVQQQSLASLHASLTLHARYGTISRTQPISMGIRPAKTIFHGYDLFETETERALVLGMADFLDQWQVHKDYYTRLSIPAPPHHELTVATAHKWVQKPLLAAAANMFARPHGLSPSDLLQRYDVAVRAVRRQMHALTTSSEKEQLLVAVFLLAVIEVQPDLGVRDERLSIRKTYNESIVVQRTYFETVGELLLELRSMSANTPDLSAKGTFHRIAFETYLAHCSTSAFLRPGAYQSVKLLLPYRSERVPSDALSNILCPHDLNVQVILFELCKLARGCKLLPHDLAERLESTRVRIDDLYLRYASATAVEESNNWTTQFEALSLLATTALKIYFSKVEDEHLSSHSPTIRSLLSQALSQMRGLHIDIMFTTDLIWIFTILLCAACTRNEVAQISQKIDELRVGFEGVRLEHLTSLLAALRQRSRGLDRNRTSDAHGIVLDVPDNLDLILQPP